MMSPKTNCRCLALPTVATRFGMGFALGCAFTALIPARAIGQVAPEESATQVQMADGLKAELWAAEPMVVNPTNLDVDSRGRVWVTEGLNYRLHKSRNREFDRVDRADRIKILEDTDGDGKADKVTVFADSIFPVPMGIAVEERYDKSGDYAGCRVYVGNSPDLLVFEDTDGDDKADKRYPLLTGFGGVDSDHGVHGVVLGIDGKLYFTHGDGCCSVQPGGGERTENFDVVDASGRHVVTDQLGTTLRVNRDGRQFEILADRQRNNYETSLNSFGNIFTSDNDDDGNRGCRVIWIMEGGTYGYRTPGSPRHWGEDAPGNVPKLVGTGNGSPSGLTVYEGTLLPEDYFGSVLEADAGTRQINHFPLSRWGATFLTEENVLMSSKDSWFRPVDVGSAPDGSLFVADWYDAGVGGHAFADQTTGRIYRIVPEGTEPEHARYDFASIDGLIEALQSPNIAAQDAARRSLIARGEAAIPTLRDLFRNGEPIHRARALWVLYGIEGDEIALDALEDTDARIREQAVRILGRDVSREGVVAYLEDAEPRPLAASEHLEALLPLANDPDPSVRRELILALRALPTEEVAEALRTLAAAWDGQDRWYLEALGLALRDREPEYLEALFDGTLYGELDMEVLGASSHVALPPYYPVDRNEAYLSVHDELPPSNALGKTLGLMWQVHRPAVLPLLTRLLPRLHSPVLRQAADDILTQIDDPAGALALAELLFEEESASRRRSLLLTLAERLDRDWRGAADDPRLRRAIEASLALPETRDAAIEAAAATGDRRYAASIIEALQDESAAVPTRAAAVEAIARLRPDRARALLEAIVDQARRDGASDPIAEAALRALPELGFARDRLVEITVDTAYPLGLRREALRSAAQRSETAAQILDLAAEGQLPDDLTVTASTLLNAHPDGRIRRRASEVLSLAKAGGRPLPPIAELLRRRGDPERGRRVFFEAGEVKCASCHRVQGRGEWIGPDLSTIGTKYGRDGLLTSILNPSEAIGYNFRSVVAALADGRILTGLPVEDTPERLVIKTAEGERLALDPSEIEERATSDLSLMPEGLAQQLSDQELVDLLAFLETLERPVSIVGEFSAVGPLVEVENGPAVDPARIDLTTPERGEDGRSSPWRRLRADASGRIDLSAIAGGDASQAVYLHVPVTAPARLEARLVLETSADVSAWLDGQWLELSDPSEDAQNPMRMVDVKLRPGAQDLLLKLPGDAGGSIVVTFVADAPLEFRAGSGDALSER